VRTQATATGGSETIVPQVSALVGERQWFSDALSSAFQAAWKTAANRTSGKTANRHERSLDVGMAQKTARRGRRTRQQARGIRQDPTGYLERHHSFGW